MDLCVRVYDLFSSHLEIARLVHSIYYGPPQGAPPMDLEQFHLPFQEALARLVEEGLRTGEFRPAPPEDILFAVMGPVSMSMDIQLCHPEMTPGRDGADPHPRPDLAAGSPPPIPKPKECSHE